MLTLQDFRILKYILLPNDRSMNAQVQAYLDKAPHDFQQLLLHYSSLIHSQFDEVEERMGRGMIYYKLHSKPLCSLGHFAKHLTFFPMGTQVISDFLPRLEGFHTTK